VGAVFGFDRLRASARALSTADDFERRAVRQLIIELVDEQTAIARQVMASAGGEASGESVKAARAAVAAWGEARKPVVDRALATVAEIEQAGDAWSFPKLTLAHSALRELAA
jgi:glutamate dehydrogenase